MLFQLLQLLFHLFFFQIYLTQTTALVTNLGKTFLDNATTTPINASLPKLPITLCNVLPRNLSY